MRLEGVVALLLALATWIPFAGCGGDETECGDTVPKPEGLFQVEYSYVSGNCSRNVQAHPIKLEYAKSGVSDIQMNRTNDRVQSILVYKGCDLGLTYNVLTKPEDDANMPSQFISSEEGTMMVMSDNELSGMVTRMEFDPPGTQTCVGEYEVNITKNETTIGAATK